MCHHLTKVWTKNPNCHPFLVQEQSKNHQFSSLPRPGNRWNSTSLWTVTPHHYPKLQSWSIKMPVLKKKSTPSLFTLQLPTYTSKMSSGEKFYGQTRQSLRYLATMTTGMLKGVKMRLPNPRAVNHLSGMVVVASCTGTVLLLVVRCTVDGIMMRATSKLFNVTWKWQKRRGANRFREKTGPEITGQ